MVASKDPELDAPGPDDLYGVGVAGTVARMMKVPDGTLRILVQGDERIRILDYVSEEPYLVARIEAMPDVIEASTELEALTRNVQSTFSEIIEAIPYLPEELQLAVANLDEPSALSHLIAGALRISTEEKQELLETVDVTKRLRRLSEILTRELEVVQLGSKIQSQVESEIDKGQREYFLRQQLKAIQEELGEGDEQQAEINELRERIEAGRPPRGGAEGGRPRALPAGEAAAGRRRVRRDPHLPRVAGRSALVEGDRGQPRHRPRAGGPRRGPLRPRGGQGPDPRVPGRPQAQPRLAGADPLLRRPAGSRARPASAARSPRRSAASSSASRSGASATRPRSAVTAAPTSARCPGTIIRALRDAGTRNPVFMIDEIDKMGADFRGDPSSAMLEVLDPAQNSTFRDHYLDLPFDLSEVLFIATANILDTVPLPLQDRMEVIQLAGYTIEEKLHIAKRYLVPRQLAANGLKASQIEFADPALTAIIDEYTPRGGRPQPRARDRHDLPQGRPPGRRGQGQGQGADLGQAGPRAARQAPLLLRDSAAGPRTPASPPGWPGRRSAARCSSSRRRRSRARAS